MVVTLRGHVGITWDKFGILALGTILEIAEARLAWWADKSRWGQTDPAVLLSEYELDNIHEQLELF